MKTIKGAAGSKSNLLKWLALPILMLVAFLNVEIGGGTTPGSEVQKPSIGPDIGGNSVPRHYATTTGDIGGGQETRKFTIGPDIGGQGTFPPKSRVIGGSQTLLCPLVNAPETGEPVYQTVPRDKPFGDIGGSQTAPRSYAVIDPIGGNSGPVGPRNKPGDIGGGKTIPKPFGYALLLREDNTEGIEIPIGGNACPRCGMLSMAIEVHPIGGGQTPPRPIDIGGGQLPPKSLMYISSFLQDCTVAIGDNPNLPTFPLGIGGNGMGSTAPRNLMPDSI